MKEEHAVTVILITGLALSLITKSYIGIVFAALGIPLYLAYLAREQNILVKARLFDRDLFLMMGITLVIILAFKKFSDPRIGLISMAVVIPLAFLIWDRLKGRE
ncbi:hypothetical protein PAP_09240 [Palaeococcus pacificus DY20341]|uniref:Uncharacterized protein n=1 Tax=Palaeococcus pacificus DY20341 TaxID=1343739 RepID=A0A075LVP7_9EURY|nr:hypothetical protein [Palaeococcus pacificus]AIF70226.1 hypothetical protein PAP_09240 [Palaeococcus pacificus DY20341]